MKTTKKWSKRFLLAMLAVTLAFGLVLTGCPTEDDGGNTDPKSITITAITGISGVASVAVLSSLSEEDMVAMGTGTIASGTLTVALKNQSDQDWTGNGDYFVAIQSGSTMYVYTNGKTLVELGSMENIPKLGIDSASTSVAFDKFVSIP